MQFLLKYLYLLRLRSRLSFGLRGIGILHLLVVGALLSGLLSLSSLASFFLSGSFGSILGINAFLESASLLLYFVEVALNDRSSEGPQLVQFGNIDALGSIVALIIQPVLAAVSLVSLHYDYSHQAHCLIMDKVLTSATSSLPLMLVFSSSLANSAYCSSSLARRS